MEGGFPEMEYGMAAHKKGSPAGSSFFWGDVKKEKKRLISKFRIFSHI